jgi:hypothetical protein
MSETITTTTAREGIQTLGTMGAEPVGWDGCEDMPEAYGHACAERPRRRSRRQACSC